MKETSNADSSKSENNSILSEISSFFTSARTTIFLLFILAGSSILGTVIPQTTEVGPVATFSQKLIAILDLNNVYRSWWFATLLGLLTLNLLGCLLERLPSIPTEWKGENQKSTFSFTIHDSRNPSDLKKLLVQALKKPLGSPKDHQNADNLTWVKNRIHLLGFPFIHIAIIVILAGGLIGLFYGYRGHVLIKEGESAYQFTLQSGQTRNLPFSIFIDAFSLTHYPTGEPKEFRSDVRLVENGHEALKGYILVNHPMTYKGISLFQSDYRVVGVKEVRFAVTDSAGKATEFSLRPYTSGKLPGTDDELSLQSLDPGGTKRGAGAELSVARIGEQPRKIRVYRKDTDGAKIGDLEIRYLDYVPLYATGLQVGYDPGAVVVWAGCAFLVIGFFLTLFTNHRGVSIQINTEEGRTRIQVSGRSRRMRREFRESVEKIVRDALQASGGQPN